MGNKRGIGKVLFGLVKMVVPSPISEISQVITQSKKAKKEALDKGQTVIEVLNYPAVQKSLDFNEDDKVDIHDLQYVLSLNRKALFKKLLPLVLGIIAAIISIKYGINLF